MSIYRQLLQREFEDQELERVVSSMHADQKARGQKAASVVDAEKLHEAKMLQLKLRMQKEAEQLREEQLLRLKHMQKVLWSSFDKVHFYKVESDLLLCLIRAGMRLGIRPCGRPRKPRR